MISTSISCTELAQKVDSAANANVKILFTTMKNALTAKSDCTVNNAPAFIPNSVFFDFENEFVNRESPFSNMMPSISIFESAAQRLGLSLDDEIVIYDDFGNFCASRAWFMLLSMGFTNIRILDGGLPEWIKSNYPTTTALESPCLKSAGTIRLQPSVNFTFVDANYIALKLANSERVKKPPHTSQLIDARSNARFTGVEPEQRPNIRSGHIPTSSNIHYASLQIDGAFKSAEELMSIFDEHGINLRKEIVISCGSGITACIVAQAAHSLGASCVKVYDASWSEWGASKTLPIEPAQ